MNNESLEVVIQDIWRDIEKWYQEHSSYLYSSLKEGILEQRLIAFEHQIGLSLPTDYKASLKIHNGDVYFNDYNYLSLDKVQHNWLSMNQLNQEGTFDNNEVIYQGQEVQNVWWNPKWIPFAEDAEGNMICIDMAPGEDGVIGQIIYFEVSEGPSASEYQSFAEWLKSYKDDLYRGRYKVDDEDGHILEKFS